MHIWFFVLWAAGLAAACYCGVHLIRFARQGLLWRLRRRLIVAYVFIAVVPLTLILCLVILGAFIVNGQFASYLVAQKLRDRFGEIQQLNRVVVHQALHSRAQTPEQLLEELQRFYVIDLSEYAVSYPGLEITVRAGDEARAFLLSGKSLKDPVVVPSWLGEEEFAGIVMEQNRVLLRSVERKQTSVGWLTIILSLPVNPPLLDLVGAGVGPVGLVVLSDKRGASQVTPSHSTQQSHVEESTIRSSSVELPQARGWLDVPVFGVSAIDPVDWGADTRKTLEFSVVIIVNSRIYALNQRLLRTLGTLSSLTRRLFVIVAAAFFIVELVALLIGILLTRSITSTVDKLHWATEKVKAGDLSHRINLPVHDQLSELGGAFNNMTASLERLLKESQEKARSDKELQIAREVQIQLFPRSKPQVPGLDIYGVCRPARVMSGDYYDFFKLGDSLLGFVLGDISGKGVSAALLMAVIQSALRAQLYDGDLSKCAPATISPAHTLARLNRHIFDNSAAETYVTFFYAVYDAVTRRLTYTNAGHPPPFLFRCDRIERLETGGTVVGLFETAFYSEAVVELQIGDVLLLFTDGITEPQNSLGEEFGVNRLKETVLQVLNCSPEILTGEVFRRASAWTTSQELQDDMTMLYIKAME